MKFFCINLVAQKERREHCEKQFEKAGLNITFVTGFPAGMSKLSFLLNRLNKGMIGCYISHERLIEEISRSEYGPCMIFEDDMELKANFVDELAIVMDQLPQDWDIAFLGWGGLGNYADHISEIPEMPGQGWMKLVSGHPSGFYGYAVNGKKAASKMLDILHPMKTQIDVQIMEATKTGKLAGYFLKQPIVLHQGIFTTTVQRTK